jgi:hypothetical protein
MPIVPPKSVSPEQHAREISQYIADMLLEMRNMARSAGLKSLLTPLEMSFCEAFAIANRVQIPPDEAEKLRRMVNAGGHG